MDSLEQARAFFKNDIYATGLTGVVIEEAAKGYAKCSLVIEDKHLNAAGGVMGGAIFTLADLAFGVAANMEQPPTVSLNASISYLGLCRGKVLIAEANEEKLGQSTCTITVHIHDELGNKVALVHSTGFRKITCSVQ